MRIRPALGAHPHMLGDQLVKAAPPARDNAGANPRTTQDSGHRTARKPPRRRARLAFAGCPSVRTLVTFDKPHCPCSEGAQKGIRPLRLAANRKPTGGSRLSQGPHRCNRDLHRRVERAPPPFRVDQNRRPDPRPLQARSKNLIYTTLGNWVNQYRNEHVDEELPLTPAERIQLAKAQRELRDRMENEFLKKPQR